MNPIKYHLFIRITAILGISAGVLVTIGWIFDIHVLKSIMPAWNTMKFNTAFCVILLCSSLLMEVGRSDQLKKLSKGFCLLVCIISGLTFLEDCFSIDFHIDQLVFTDRDSLLFGLPFPGRMASVTSFSCVLIAVAILLMRSANKLLKTVTSYALHAVTLISFVTLIGYMYEVPDLYKLWFVVSMAAHTAIMFFFISISVALLYPDGRLTKWFTGTSIGSRMTRRLFPLTMLVIIIIGFLRFYAHHYNLISAELGIALFVVSNILVCLTLVINTGKFLNRIDSRRSDIEESYRLLNKHLEETVEKRTKHLVEIEGKFQQIFKMSPTGLMMTDVKTRRFIDVNQSFTDLTGYTKVETVGKQAEEIGLVEGEEREVLNKILQKDGFLRNQETTYLTKSGERRSALMSLEAIDVGDHQIFLTVLYDITEQKLTEQKLLEAKHQAEASSEAKERFMANMSHEIRTPMNAIIGFTNLLQKSPISEEQREYVKFIKSSGESLLVLINDILDYSKIEAGMMQIEHIAFNIADLLHSLKIMFQEKAAEKNLDLSLSIDEHIPGILMGDPTRLTQILVNLLANAIKFTGEGEIRIHVEQLTQTDDHHVTLKLTVSDTGIGIPEQKQHEVFDRFMQASTETTRNYGGTGLGLSIVKNLVELLSGTLSIKSAENEGTDFIIELPFGVGVQTESNEIASLSTGVKKQFDRKIRVLVAEDNVINQTLAEKVLTDVGCEVDIAENGGIAIEMVRSKEYDIILMDIQMPIMDGYTASRKLRDEYNVTLPIIAMTAHVMAGEREKCISYGMNDYISKPFQFSALYDIIARYTAG